MELPSETAIAIHKQEIRGIVLNKQVLKNYYDRATYNALRVVPNLPLILNPELREVCVEVTNNCNLRCLECNLRNMKRPFGYMPIELYRKVVAEVKQMRVDRLHLNFEGESFLHPKIPEFLKLSVESGATSRQMFTNGMNVGPYLKDIAKYLTKITFSIDGVGVVNDSIRLGSKYETIADNLHKLIAVRNMMGSPLKIGVNLTNYTQTPQQVQEFIDTFFSIADFVSVCEYRDSKNHYLKSGYDLRHIQNVTDKPVAKPVKYCSFPLNTIVVLWNGDVSFCTCAVTSCPPMLPFNAYKNTLHEMWTSKYWRNMRNDAAKLGYPPYPECVDCDVRRELR